MLDFYLFFMNVLKSFIVCLIYACDMKIHSNLFAVVSIEVIFLLSSYPPRSAMNTSLSNNDLYPGRLVGSWTTVYGDLDEAGTYILRGVFARRNVNYKFK